MDLDKLTKELLHKKAEENKKIDLNAYAMGLTDLKKQLASCEKETKYVIELSDDELKIVSASELIQMKKDALEFDGFEGWIVRGILINKK